MEISKVIKYRSIWMGLAIIWVVLFHAPIELSNPLFQFIKSCGYGGVDIFIFASGIGCYFSYTREHNLKEFIKRRFWKLMPTYFVFIGIWLLFEQNKHGVSINSILGNIFCIQELTGNEREFNWYVTLIWILYLLTPYFVMCIDSIKSFGKMILFIIILFLFTMPFWTSLSMLLVVRILLFAIGMYVAKNVNNTMSFTSIVGLITISIVGSFGLWYLHQYHMDKLWGYGGYWYPFVLIVPGLCVILSVFSYHVEKICVGRWGIKAINFLGKYTFEIFLVHILAIDIYEWYLSPLNIITDIQFSYLLFFAIVPLGVVILWLGTKCFVKLITCFERL